MLAGKDWKDFQSFFIASFVTIEGTHHVEQGLVNPKVLAKKPITDVKFLLYKMWLKLGKIDQKWNFTIFLKNLIF
jgi:hypothetical protein